MLVDESDWTPENIAWLAGLLEGEGCFSLRYYKKYTYVSTRIVMTDFDVIDKIAEVVKEGTIMGPHSRKNSSNKPWKTWTLNEREPQMKLFEKILPWLGNRRREKVQQCLDILRANTNHRYRKNRIS